MRSFVLFICKYSIQCDAPVLKSSRNSSNVAKHILKLLAYTPVSEGLTKTLKYGPLHLAFICSA